MTPKPVTTFTAVPSLPPTIERLRELAYNVRWAWHEDTLDLFRRLDPQLWTATGHNPVRLLGTIPQQRLVEAAADEGFLAQFEDVCDDFDGYMDPHGTWYARHGRSDGLLTAYFSAEFGVTECMPIFAGGLGVLAGDHLKSASDLGIPIVGIGLMYQQGYFRQHLDASGWQQETYQENDCANLPLILECDDRGRPLQVAVDYKQRPVYSRIWHLQVGRVPLYLLDTNFESNLRDEDRDLTDYLYGGGNELRVRQEIMLGIGGYRALKLLNLHPKVYHVNEGHSAFLALEHIRELMRSHQMSFDEAQVAASASVVFTTHTPVEAGHDRFPPDLMDRYMVSYAKDELKLSRRDFLALGRENADRDDEFFGMTKLALRMSASSNGVAHLHGQVSRAMWQRLWPDLPENEVPIGHVTNGIHIASWVSADLKQLLDRYIGRRWRDEPCDVSVWSSVSQIPDHVLWQTHVRRRERLVNMARLALQQQLEHIGAPRVEIDRAAGVLDPNTLTIGFARRFATYKRATLLLHDRERLERILNNQERPVQILFAGKAHPRDHPGKELIQQIVALSRTPAFRHRVVFLEDYDMSIARYLLQGADLWLNTPRRPREASGTSGMKAAANGGLNFSILDGWWEEGFDPDIGWAIGDGRFYEDSAYQDEIDVNSLYDRLEYDILPMFYDRSAEGLPLEWIQRMKRSIATYSAMFNSHRMISQYVESAYLTAAERAVRLSDDNLVPARQLAAWQARVARAWPQVAVDLDTGHLPEKQIVGEAFGVQARVHLGALTPDDVDVQLYLGRVTSKGAIVEPQLSVMTPVRAIDQYSYLYEASDVRCHTSGSLGYTVRVLPRHPDLVSSFSPGLVTWANGAG
ncbi:MAG: alpha-glucan family phosphorylase [Bacteroidota bacterium]|nr:alpha-glucan family phosphorylase [Bacteroidota bacterium]